MRRAPGGAENYPQTSPLYTLAGFLRVPCRAPAACVTCCTSPQTYKGESADQAFQGRSNVQTRPQRAPSARVRPLAAVRTAVVA